MSQQSLQSILATGLGLMFLMTVYKIARLSKLSFRYAVGWLLVGVMSLIAALLIPFTGSVAEKLNVTPSAVLVIGTVFLVVTICIQLSISISGMQNQIYRLAEDIALFKEEVAEKKNGDINT